ncbi:hypothetical protein CsSME_00028802 [Camellia sinensis var. sinensis]
MSKYQEALAKRMATAGLKPHHRIGLSLHTLFYSLFVFIFMGELDFGLLNFTNRWADVDEQGYGYSFSIAVSVLSGLSPHCATFVCCVPLVNF